jgi:hypothetical protein
METSPTVLRLRPTGVAAILAVAMVLSVGVFTLSAPLLSIGLSGGLLLLLSRRFAGRQFLGILVSRSNPRRVTAGESFAVSTMIEHARCPSDRLSITFTDPLFSGRHTKAAHLTAAKPASLPYPGRSMRRGWLTAKKWTIRSTWPLGLFEAEMRGEFREMHPVLVRPAPFLPARLRARLNRLAQNHAAAALDPPEPYADFRYLREFRSGDPVRSIQWPATLRSGRMQVAELEHPHPAPRRYGVLIHSYTTQGQILKPEDFEMILRIATGLVTRFQREEIALTFCHFPDPAHRLDTRPAIHRELDQLALSSRNPLKSLAPILDALSGFGDCDEIFVLSDCPRQEWEENVKKVFQRAICIDSTSLSDASRPALKTKQTVSG